MLPRATGSAIVAKAAKPARMAVQYNAILAADDTNDDTSATTARRAPVLIVSVNLPRLHISVTGSMTLQLIVMFRLSCGK